MIVNKGFHGRCLHHTAYYEAGWNLLLSKDFLHLIPNNIKLTVAHNTVLRGKDVLTHFLYKILSDSSRNKPLKQAIWWLKLSFPKLNLKERRLLIIAVVDWVRHDQSDIGSSI